MLRNIIKTTTIPDDKVVTVHDDLIMQLLKVYSVGEPFFFFWSFCFGAELVAGILLYTQEHQTVKKRRILQRK